MTRRGTPQPYSLGLEFSLEQPLDYEDARSAARTFAEQRSEARKMLESAYGELAEGEANYRRARRRARAEAPRVERGEVTAGDRDDEVDAATAEERETRDVAKYKVEAIKERLEEIDATRASFHRLIEWSARIDPAAQEDRAPALDPLEQLRQQAARAR
jgi:hypothetical protein